MAEAVKKAGKPEADLNSLTRAVAYVEKVQKAGLNHFDKKETREEGRQLSRERWDLIRKRAEAREAKYNKVLLLHKLNNDT